MKVYCLLESHCGDPYELMYVFGTKEAAETYRNKLLEDEDTATWYTFWIQEMGGFIMIEIMLGITVGMWVGIVVIGT